MKEQEKILKALANQRRLRILKALKGHRELSVGEVADRIKLSFKATSKHLSILSNSDLVQKEQRSVLVYYRLSREQKQFVRQLLDIL